MPLFACTNCECIENSASSNYWSHVAMGTVPLCSLCDPTIGKWHGFFERTPLSTTTLTFQGGFPREAS